MPEELAPHSFSFEGVDYTFHVLNPDDYIQAHHLRGELFDYDELQEMDKYLSDGDVIVDVGANVGNHAVYFSKRFPRSRILVFEPNREAGAILRANLDANACRLVDRRFIGVALSARRGEVTMERGTVNNLGGTRIVEPADPSTGVDGRRPLEVVPTMPADEALAELDPRLVKIDVEGHEFEVLAGMEGVIARARPTLFVEVSNPGRDRFATWLSDHDYRVAWLGDKYRAVTNYLVVPASGP